jgi:hypothetical protein
MIPSDNVTPADIEIREESDGRFVLYVDGESILSNRFIMRQAAVEHTRHPGTLAIARQMRVTKREYGPRDPGDDSVQLDPAARKA